MRNRRCVRQEVSFACSCTQIITELCKLNESHTSGTLSLISHGRAPDSIPLLSMCKTWHLFHNFVRICHFTPASFLSAIVPYWSVIRLWYSRTIWGYSTKGLSVSQLLH